VRSAMMRSAPLRYALAAANTLVALFLARLVPPWLRPLLLIPFVLAVAVTAWVGGLGPGLLALSLSTLAQEEIFLGQAPAVGPLDPAMLGAVLALLLTAGLPLALIHRLQQERRAAGMGARDVMASEARYRRVVETASEGIWMVDMDGHVRYANGRMAEMLGLTSEALEGAPAFDFVVPEDLPVAQRLRAEVHQGRPGRYDIRFRRRDGEVLWMLVSAAPIYDEEERLLGCLCMLTDIAERKQADGAVRHWERRYRTLAQQFPNGAVFLFDRDLRVLIAEGSGLPAMGLPTGALEGKTIWEALPAETCELIEPIFRAALAGQSTTATATYNGRLCQVRAVPVRDDTGESVTGMAVIRLLVTRG
jgi:PAS domain S-box-containing protein